MLSGGSAGSESGKVIGVDMTPEMVEKPDQRGKTQYLQ
jgi:hypothetical protein